MELKLYYLGEVSGMTKEQVEEAEKFIKGFEYGIIATCNAETGPRLSALNNLAGQTLQQLHFATEATTQKLANLRQDPRCEVMYATLEGGQMQIAGKAEIVTDVELKRELWQDWMNEYS
ncbi:pyridoxamine 5'-phosphate oxidase family protein, partial [Parabacteroides goldsteinii]